VLATAEAARLFAGRYEILAKLGAGAFGVVYRARDRVLDREVALKVLKLDKLGDSAQAEEYKQRFLREAQVVAKLRHPNIIPVYDLGEAQGYHYIAMQLVTGRPLDDWLRENGTMSAEKVVRIGVALADALASAHDKGIIHRDIKPANIILEGEQPQIADFGIAKVQHDPSRTRDDVVVGTLSYMSPEQLRAEPLDGRSDLFSLACVLLELLTRHRAFDGANMTVIVNKIVNEPVDMKELETTGVPSALIGILRKALEKEKEKRFQDGRDLRDALEKLLPERQADTAEIQRLASEIEKLRQEKKRANVAMVGVVVLAAAVFGGAKLSESNLATFLPVLAIVSPAILLGLFYRDVLKRLSPVYWMLSGLFTVLVLVDSYYFGRLAVRATELATLFKQTIPAVTIAHAMLVGTIVDQLFFIALVLNLAIVLARARREEIVDFLNRIPVVAGATLVLAGVMIFMFAAMAGHWDAMAAGVNMQFAGSKIRELEETGQYQAVIEKFVKGAPAKVFEDPIWQRRMARMYRVSGQTAKMEECWANLGRRLNGGWDPASPAGWLAVGRDFARLELYREDAVAVFRKGLAALPGDPELTEELAKVTDRMGFPLEAANLRNPPPPPPPDSSAAPPPSGSAAPATAVATSASPR
jgi:predicted Ser/Thr protein kinase